MNTPGNEGGLPTSASSGDALQEISPVVVDGAGKSDDAGAKSTTSVPLDVTSAYNPLKIVAAAYRQPDAIPALIDVLGESDTYMIGEPGRVWRSLVVLHNLGEPINRDGLTRCLEDMGEPNIERTLDDVERVADSFKGDNPGAAAVRRAEELVKAAGASEVKIEAERKTPIKYYVSTYLGEDTLHVDLVELAKSDKREALAAKIAEVSGLAVDDVQRRLIKIMAQADEVANAQAEEKAGPPEKQAELLLGLCGDVEFTHDADNTAYATWIHEGARQTHRLRTTAFKTWLAWMAYRRLDLVPSNNAMQEALTTLEGKAIHDGELVQVHRRVAEHDSRVYLDLCDEKWQAVEVTGDGWRLVNEPPVRFIRGTGMLALPEPVKGDVHALRDFLNVVDDADFQVCLAWLIGAIQPRGPYPVLSLSGRQGSAKSTAARLLAGLIDPNKAPLRSEPKSEDDMIVAAQHSRLIAFDNVSNLSSALSDALCRLATGGGAAKRKLYTDDEAVILDVQAPVILTGIGTYITRGDLADRALPVQLRPLRDGEYLPERKLWERFNEARPGILGGLLDALGCSIRRQAEVAGTSRMADFDAAVEAAGPALGWQPGHFNKLLADVRDKSRRSHLEDDELAQALISLAGIFEGTVGELHHKLGSHGNVNRWLPKTARSLGNAIRRLEPLLENVGVVVHRTTRNGKRVVILENHAGNNVHHAHQEHEPRNEGDSGGARTDSQRAPSAPDVHPDEALDVEPRAQGARGARAGTDDPFNEADLEAIVDGAKAQCRGAQ
ncbi:MAG: hypothetical protein H6839_02870 [Planctomycetes bacterium]|nr:hypothetical protein [Planctomycetota bacterium]